MRYVLSPRSLLFQHHCVTSSMFFVVSFPCGESHHMMQNYSTIRIWVTQDLDNFIWAISLELMWFLCQTCTWVRQNIDSNEIWCWLNMHFQFKLFCIQFNVYWSMICQWCVFIFTKVRRFNVEYVALISDMQFYRLNILMDGSHHGIEIPDLIDCFGKGIKKCYVKKDLLSVCQ